jgi:hypothetical protein
VAGASEGGTARSSIICIVQQILLKRSNQGEIDGLRM